MTRISLIEPAQASPEVKEIYESKLKGKPGNIQKALAHRPAMLGNFLGFYASVGQSIDRKLYEAVYLRVSLINGCHTARSTTSRAPNAPGSRRNR
jgi:alkylhydroperoxidase family enzyme